jgi:conjugative relaxase-like TrwC/TraI family protein
MMTLSPPMMAEQASVYFSSEDYYLGGTEEGRNTLWYGRGAEALGLAGPVREEEFRPLCRGEDPQGKRIVKYRPMREKGVRVEKHRAGNDCTFSAPKSVSIAHAAGVEGIKEAHDAAVLAVLEHMERHYCHYRVPGGELKGGMVCAKFDHATSRNFDPQLHSHVFYLSAVQTREGDWKASEPKIIFENQKSLGLLYRLALARELTERGYGITISNRSLMYFELAGVDPRLIEHFSSRTKEIEEQVELWTSEKKFPGVSHARLCEMATLETRDPKRQMSRDDLVLVLERGFQACGSSMERVKRELEESRAPYLARERPLPEPAARVVELAAHDLTNREAVLKRARLLDRAVQLSGGRHGVGELDAAIDGGAEGVLRLGQNAKGREFYTTREMRELEARNLERVRGLAPFRSVVREGEVEGYLERIALEDVRPTAGQQREVYNELAGEAGLTVTLGDPGTAKTYTLKLIERFNDEVLRPDGREHFSIDVACTAKAAREMSRATGRPAFTAHSFLRAWQASKFDLQGEESGRSMLVVGGEKILIPEGAQVVLRVDEASFLGARQAGELLRVVEELQARGVQAKLHLLGDIKQMQAVAAGDLLRQVRELGERGEVDYAHLTDILRQKELSLLEVARNLNREDRPLGENAREAVVALEKQGHVIEIPERPGLKAAVVERYLEESGRPSNFPERAAAGKRQTVVLVVATNAEREELNRDIRSARVRAGEIEAGRSFKMLSPASQGVTVEGYQVGDSAIFWGERDARGRPLAGEAPAETVGRVTGIDRDLNLVTVSYSFTKGKGERAIERTVVRDYSPTELERKSAHFRQEERNFAVGDRIIALHNNKGLKVENGTLGTIRELSDDGVARVDLGDRETTLDLNRYRQVDHAYAVTIHRSQGATLEHSILFAQVRPEREPSPGKNLAPAPDEEWYAHTSYNALNVAVTRAQFGATIFTNSVAGLTRSVETVDVKTSTRNKILGVEQELKPGMGGRDFSAGGAISEQTRKLRDLTLELRREGNGLHPAVESLGKLRVREIQRSVREIPTLQKNVARQLEVALAKKSIGLELER